MAHDWMSDERHRHADRAVHSFALRDSINFVSVVISWCALALLVALYQREVAVAMAALAFLCSLRIFSLTEKKALKAKEILREMDQATGVERT